jgi:DNA-binding NarL/FixJ family response regulator
LVTGDELDRQRFLHLLEDGGFLVEDVQAGARVDVVVLVGELLESDDRSSFEGVPLVLVTPVIGRTAVRRALAAGALGVVEESEVADRLAATVHAVAVGQVCIPADHEPATTRTLLSPREKQVLAMVVLGFTNQEIANKLHVTETTVKSHLSSAYRKLHVRSRHEATALILSDPTLGLGILTLAGDRAGD